MTDARIEAAFEAAWNEPCLLGDPIACHNLDDVCVHETQQENIEAMKGVVRKMIVAALTAADAAAWRPISEAKKDGSPILAKLRNNIYPPVTDESSLRARADYRWNGLTIVLRHPGLANDGFDMGWNVAAPVGHGGFPDDWIEGWQPLPAPPTKETTP